MNKYILVSVEHTDINNHPLVFTLWQDDFSGYTTNLNKAGRYTLEEITNHYKGFPKWMKVQTEKICDFSNFNTIAVLESDLEKYGYVSQMILGF